MHFIPVANPHARYVAHQNQIELAVKRVLSSGYYIQGQEVKDFERDFAAFSGSAYCVGVANGTDAIYLALKALDIGTGDEVITVAHTAVATIAAIEAAGATPVLIDVDYETRCISPHHIEAALTDKTRALIPVHIYGRPCDMMAICQVAKKYNLKIIEDCAQAHGAAIGESQVGSFSDIAAYSFYPTKNLGCFGDGGAITTNSKTLAEKIRQIAQYGWKERYISDICGTNSRLDEIHAASLQMLLKNLKVENDQRVAIAHRYINASKSSKLVCPKIHPELKQVFHLFVVNLESKVRGGFMEHLSKLKISSAVHYPLPVHLQPAYKKRVRISGTLSNTERLAQEIVTIPLFPELTESEVERVCEALASWK